MARFDLDNALFGGILVLSILGAVAADAAKPAPAPAPIAVMGDAADNSVWEVTYTFPRIARECLENTTNASATLVAWCNAAMNAEPTVEIRRLPSDDVIAANGA